MAAACGSVAAAPVYYTAENMLPLQSTTGDPLFQRNQLLSQLGVSGTESFDSDPTNNRSPLDLVFEGQNGSFSGTLTQTTTNGSIIQTPSSGGRFNTTGAESGPTPGKWFSTSQSFDISFGQNISAFGFYATDFGDRTGQISVVLTDVNDVRTTRDLNNTEGTAGGLLFWGFYDAANQYKSISILLNQRDTSNGADIVGFDDFVVGISTPTTTVPEPATLALLAACAIGATAARRRA